MSKYAMYEDLTERNTRRHKACSNLGRARVTMWATKHRKKKTQRNGNASKRRWKIRTIIIKLDCSDASNARKVSAIICNRIICIRRSTKIAIVYTRLLCILSSFVFIKATSEPFVRSLFTKQEKLFQIISTKSHLSCVCVRVSLDIEN